MMAATLTALTVLATGGSALAQTVEIGDEDQAGSLGRVAVWGSRDEIVVYAEDYSEADMFADLIEATDKATGCVLIACDPETDSPSDAAAIRIPL